MNHNDKILKVAQNFTILKLIPVISDGICIKTLFLNALLNRWESHFTQDDVAEYLGISKRTVVKLEKGHLDSLTSVIQYINLFGKDYPGQAIVKNQRRYYKRIPPVKKNN